MENIYSGFFHKWVSLKLGYTGLPEKKSAKWPFDGGDHQVEWGVYLHPYFFFQTETPQAHQAPQCHTDAMAR